MWKRVSGPRERLVSYFPTLITMHVANQVQWKCVVIFPSAARRCLVSVGVVRRCLVTVRLGDDSVRGHYLPSGPQTDARGPHAEQLKPNYIHTIRSAPPSCLRHAPTHSNVLTHTNTQAQAPRCLSVGYIGAELDANIWISPTGEIWVFSSFCHTWFSQDTDMLFS